MTDLCDGNLSEKNLTLKNRKFSITQTRDICKQLIEGLEQLKKANKCHNDLKPDNILYKVLNVKYGNGEPVIEICFGDFSTEGKSGGTPGWTWPKFRAERKPGESDMFSVGQMLLYTMCRDKILFYRIRNNYIKGDPSWLHSFRTLPLINLVLEMMNIQISVHDARKRWKKITNLVEMIDRNSLKNMGVDVKCLDAQDDLDYYTLDGVTYNER